MNLTTKNMPGIQLLIRTDYFTYQANIVGAMIYRDIIDFNLCFTTNYLCFKDSSKSTRKHYPIEYHIMCFNVIVYNVILIVESIG